MKKMLTTILVGMAISPPWLAAQGPPPEQLGASPQAIGAPGVAWYTTWGSALAEAQRSQRPIFFMAAAATCGGISGVF